MESIKWIIEMIFLQDDWARQKVSLRLPFQVLKHFLFNEQNELTNVNGIAIQVYSAI